MSGRPLAHAAPATARALAPLVALANTVEARIPFIHAHAQRVAGLAVRLAHALEMTRAASDRLHDAALLHDIGKIAVPDHILMKAGALTDDEWTIMRRHAATGGCIVGLSLPELERAIRHHHERWDGSGYPDGLRGTAIPLDARLLAVVDAWDALTSDRPYRRALPLLDACLVLRDGRGVIWDANLVDVFLQLIEACQ